VGTSKQARGWGQHFVGPRVNCENVPCLPAAAVAWVLNDPRQVPYLMVWKNDRWNGEVVLAARVAAYSEPAASDTELTGCVEVKRPDGTCNWIWTIERPLPRHGGKARLLICPRCQRPRRALYPWKLNPSKPRAVFISTWQCRSCAGLRYASEGGALVFHPRTDLGRLIEALEGPSKSPRPEPWYPYVLADPRQAADIVRVIHEKRC
jgi:hypothetical protein